MAKTKVGTVTYWQTSSAILAIFRLAPQADHKFPAYKAGQYIALQRNDCRLTKKVVHEDKRVEYPSVLDAQGNQKRGPVTHSYSIASAPFETEEQGYLEFYVILEIDEKGIQGRLTESMFRMSLEKDNKLHYYDKIAGDFTLDKRAVGLKDVVLVGTGTGLAPFVSMIKQLDFEAAQGKTDGCRYTLIHTNRTYEELDYYKELVAIESAKRFDFVYVPSVSRPTQRDLDDPKMGKGRANNLLRHLFEMALKEEQDLQEGGLKGEDTTKAAAALQKTVRPALPEQHPLRELQQRMNPAQTVIITCGNPWSMEDIKYVADSNRMKFEKEDW
jgi:ferredoxin-NADP reductase